VSKNCTAAKRGAIRKSVDGRGRRGRTSNSKTDWHEDPNKVINDLEHGPFLCAQELPGPRGKNEGVPGGDGQRAHEEILVGRQMGREL